MEQKAKGEDGRQWALTNVRRDVAVATGSIDSLCLALVPIVGL